MAKTTKYALVLSGGGFKGAFQVGALNHLAENWSLINPNSDKMHFDLVAGISVGSLNGGMIAMDKLEELNQIWRQVADNGVEEVYTSDLIDTESESETPRLKADLNKLKDRFLPKLKIKIDLWKGLGMFLNKKKQVQFFEDVMKSVGTGTQKHPLQFQEPGR
jgi:NTE family protein